jgi:hypothetical protein
VSEVEVVRAALRHAAKKLDSNLATFSGNGALGDVQARGRVTAGDLGDWDAGRALAATSVQAHLHFANAYSRFMNEYELAISALLKTAASYDDAEAETLKRVQALFGTIGGTEG